MKQTHSQKGSIVVLTAITLPVLIFATGMAIDYSRWHNAKTVAHQTAEAVALRVVRERLLGAAKSEAKLDGREEFLSQRVSIPGSDDAKVSIRPKSIDGIFNADVVVSGSIATTFLKIGGIKKLDFEVDTAASFSATNFEVALILDISQSMGKELENLKDAAENFINILYDVELPAGIERTVTLIPYADTVNFGPAASSYLHSDPAISAPSDFVGCFRPFSAADIVTTTPTELPGQFRAYKNKIRGNGNPHCPPDDSATLMFSKNKDDLIDRIRAFDFGFGTGSDIAMSWGWRALSPSWRGRFNESSAYPKNFAANQQKIIVFLTDGRPHRADPMGDQSVRSSPAEHRKALENLETLCNSIESEDEISLYSIGFSLNEADAENQRVLRNCTAGGGQYYSPNPRELENVFESIAQQIISVRVTE